LGYLLFGEVKNGKKSYFWPILGLKTIITGLSAKSKASPVRLCVCELEQAIQPS
jgi:hypothetical protein